MGVSGVLNGRCIRNRKVLERRFSRMDMGRFSSMDIGKLGRIVCYLHLYLYSSYYLLEIPAFPRNGIWKTEIVFSKLSLNKHNQCM